MSKEQEWASKQNDLFKQMNDIFNPQVMKDLNDMMDSVITDHRKQNSREARERSLPKAGTDKAIILKIIKSYENLYPNGINAVKICQHSVHLLDYHSVQRRMSELVRADLVEVAGKKDGYTLYKIKEVAK